jgi:hypothetical protein
VFQEHAPQWVKPSTTSLVLGTFVDLTRSKAELLAENALLPTGCATRCSSSVNWLENVFVAPLSSKGRDISDPGQKKARELSESVKTFEARRRS